MKKIKGDQIHLVFLIILPMVFILALDLTPFSKSVQTMWQKLETTSLTENNELWITTASRILEYQPWQLSLWDRLATKQFEQGKFEDSINTLNFILTKKPLTIEQSILLSQAYFEIDLHEKSAEIWRRILDDPGVGPEQLKKLYKIQQKSGDWAGAYQSLKKWHQIDPNHPEALQQLLLSEILYEPEKAIQIINALALTEFDFVMTDLKTILSSDNTTYRLVLAGNIYAKLGEWNYAVEAYSKVVELDPTYAEGWAFYGNSLINTGENGYFALEKAYNLSPKSKISRAYLASYWSNQKDFQKSIKIYEELIAEDPSEPIWYLELGNTYIQIADLEQAMLAFQKTTELDPENIYYLINLARHSGEFRFEIQNIGIPAARQALLIESQNWEVYDVIGWLYLLEREYTTAERFLSIAHQYFPESPIVNLHLGQLYSLQNRPSLANYYLEKCIKYADDEEMVSLAKKFISP